MRLVTSASLIAVALAMPAGAQTGNPAFTPSGTPLAQPGVPAPNQLNTTDRVVIEQLAIGNAAEIELANLAGQRAHSQAVKDFAQAMLHDHDAAGKRVADFAKAGSVPLPSGRSTSLGWVWHDGSPPVWAGPGRLGSSNVASIPNTKHCTGSSPG
jgi:putative membrane protein